MFSLFSSSWESISGFSISIVVNERAGLLHYSFIYKFFSQCKHNFSLSTINFFVPKSNPWIKKIKTKNLPLEKKKSLKLLYSMISNWKNILCWWPKNINMSWKNSMGLGTMNWWCGIFLAHFTEWVGVVSIYHLLEKNYIN